MASSTNISGNTYVLSLDAAESIPLYTVDFSTGDVTSAYFDQAGRIALKLSLAPLLGALSAPVKSSAALPILLSCVTVDGLNGNVNLAASLVGSTYTLDVAAVAAVSVRVTIAHTVQGGFVGGPAQDGGAPNPIVDFQAFTLSGTWTKPAGAIWVRVFALGGGGGGGSGRVDVAGTDRFGGGGGWPGDMVDVTFLAANLPASVPVTIGAGGAGAAGTAGTGDGAQGDSGFDTLFGITPTTGIAQIRAFGGVGGSPGTSVATGNAPYPGLDLTGLSFGYPNPTGFPFAFPTEAVVNGTQNVSFPQSGLGPAGGGAGGGLSAANTAYRGLRGQFAAFNFATDLTKRGVGGTVPGGAGTAGSPEATAVLALFGIGAQHGNAGGGAGNAAGNVNGGAGASASGTYGTGGGGGGAATNPATSGAGGDGANGYLAVVCW